MKRLSLRTRLIIVFLIVAIVGFLTLSIVGRMFVEMQEKTSMIRKMHRAADTIASLYQSDTGTITKDNLKVMAAAENLDIWIMDLNGRIVASTNFDETDVVVSDFRPVDGINGYYMVGSFYGMYSSNVLSVYATLARDAAPRGYVILHYPTVEISSSADRSLLASYITFFLMVFLLLLTGLYFEVDVIRPIKKTVQLGHEYVNQNLTYPCPKMPKHEIGEIALTEQELAKQLQSSADDQHKFLQNISHDFRSPLTSIRGYMVAMQDGTIPHEMQGKYLDVVIGETDRLTNMANELLDVTQLENGVILDKTVFDINEMIRDLLPSYEGRVEEKNLSFEVTFETVSQTVYADRQRIGQVIHNLVDNAVKFSNAGGTIDISTHLSGEKVFVSVKDHGIGIEPENIKKIWNRFYKTDPSRGRDKKGTGLGLSIVRDIIQNHRENIDVISTPGVGTEFIFTLPPGEESS